MGQLSEEQKERVKQELKRRLAIARGIEIESGSAKDRAFVDGGIAAFELLLDDLSLLDSDSQAAARPVGWQSAVQRADPRVVTVTFETRECAEAFINGLEPTIGPVVAATAMRDKCVDAIKSLRATPHGAAYSNAINDAIHKIESLTLDQVKPENKP